MTVELDAGLPLALSLRVAIPELSGGIALSAQKVLSQGDAVRPQSKKQTVGDGVNGSPDFPIGRGVLKDRHAVIPLWCARFQQFPCAKELDTHRTGPPRHGIGHGE